VYEKKFMQDDMNLYKTQLKMYQGVCGKWCDTNAPPTSGIPFEIAEHQIRTLRKRTGMTFFAKTPLTKATLANAKIDSSIILNGKHLDPKIRQYSPYFRFFVPFRPGYNALQNGIRNLIAKIPLFAAIAKKNDFITKFSNFQKRFKTIITPRWIGGAVKKAQQKITETAKKAAENVKKFGKLFGGKIKDGFKNIGKGAKKVGETAKKIGKNIGNFAKDVGQNIGNGFNKVRNFGKGVKRRFGRGWKKFRGGVGRRVRGIRRNVKRLGRYFGGNAKKGFQFVKNRFNTVKQKTKQAVKKVVGKAKEGIVNTGRKVGHVARNVRNNIRNKFQGFENKFQGFKRRVVPQAVQAVQHRVSNTVGSIKRFGGGVARRAGSVFRRIGRW
jgi:archaellum component FlaC